MELSEEHEGWIEEELGRMIAVRGARPFLAVPILLPDSEAFPDRYRSPLGAVRVTAERLLWYAGLQRRVMVEVVDDRVSTADAPLPLWELETTRVSPGRITIALRGAGRPEQLPGILAHHVARVVRATLGFGHPGAPYREAALRLDEGEVAGDADASQSAKDELADQRAALASLTTVFLGWGVLATNAAEIFVSAGSLQGNWVSHAWARESHGALHVGELAYALALQLAARRHYPEHDPEEARRVIAALGANQASFVRRALESLDPEAVAARLGLPPELPSWSPRPLIAREDEHSDEQRQVNAARPVFRVERNAAASMTPALGLGGLIGGLIAGIGGMPLVLATAVAASIGWVVGRSQRQDVCSDLRCEATIPPDAERCPRCGGIVAGTIGHANERLEAEEALPAEWWREHDLEPPGRLAELAESEPSPDPEIH